MSDFAGLLFIRGTELIIAHDIASGVVVEVGDMVKSSGGTCLACAATTDDIAFFGVAKEAHGATDPAGKISVALRNAHAVYLATLDAAASINQGDLLQIYTSAPSKKLTKSTTDPVAMAVQKTASLTTVEVVLLLPAQVGTAFSLVGAAT
jgi:uncharacterized RmlC-like cupin family protein